MKIEEVNYWKERINLFCILNECICVFVFCFCCCWKGETMCKLRSTLNVLKFRELEKKSSIYPNLQNQCILNSIDHKISSIKAPEVSSILEDHFRLFVGWFVCSLETIFAVRWFPVRHHAGTTKWLPLHK